MGGGEISRETEGWYIPLMMTVIMRVEGIWEMGDSRGLFNRVGEEVGAMGRGSWQYHMLVNHLHHNHLMLPNSHQPMQLHLTLHQMLSMVVRWLEQLVSKFHFKIYLIQTFLALTQDQ